LDFGPIIIIGGEHTKILFDELCHNKTIFTGLGLQTVDLFDNLSREFNCLVYIHTAFIVSATGCIGNEPRSPGKSPSSQQSWYGDMFGFWGKGPKQAGEDYNVCNGMADKMQMLNIWSYSAVDVSTDGLRNVEAARYYSLWSGWVNKCTATKMSPLEKKLHAENKK
jgi:hypothetical protein